MEFTEKIVSIGLVAHGSSLTVCDPCYLADDDDTLRFSRHLNVLINHDPFTLSAIDEAPLAGGTWEAYAREAVYEGWGNRVWYAGIRLVDAPGFDAQTMSEQDVDAGMVGFFINRPALKYVDTWSRDGGATCMESLRLLFHGTGLAWITSSGLGDGSYEVTANWRNGEIVAVEADYYSCYMGKDPT